MTADAAAAAQRALERHRKRGLAQTRHVYLLERLGTCGRCGAALGIASAARPSRRDRVVPARYVCCHRRRPPVDGERCAAPYHATAQVDDALWSAVADVVLAPDLVERAMRQRRDEPAVVDVAAATAKARAELARLDRAERTLLDRVERITPDALDAQLARLARSRAAAVARLAELERTAASSRLSVAATAGLAETIADLREALAGDLTAAQRRDLVRLLVSEVEVGDEALVAQLHLPADRGGLALGSGSSTAAPELHAGRLLVALPRQRQVEALPDRPAPPATDVEPPGYLAPARWDGRGWRTRSGHAVNLLACAGCGLSFWAAAGRRHCSHGCYTASGARALARSAS